MPPYPITRAEISRGKLVENFVRLRTLLQEPDRRDGCDLLAVVKADAYGHGAAMCAPWLVEAGAKWLGVTSVEEGTAIQRLCPSARILVMRGLLPEEVEPLLNTQLTATIWDLEHLDILEKAVSRRSLPSGSLPVHLEIDTGMSRQGILPKPDVLAQFLSRLRAIPALALEGVYTHFASSDLPEDPQNRQQLMCFRQAVEQIAAAGLHPRWLHAGSSSTLLDQQIPKPLAALAKILDAQLLLRPGIALYGYALPFVRGARMDTEMPIDLQPVLAWKTVIASLRTVEKGARIGYGGTFTAPREMRLALLPVGYADGLNRKLSSSNLSDGSHVLVRGMDAPIVGRVSMDLTIVDVSHVPQVAAGDEVTILGEQNGKRITADDHARWAGTIPYEILCAIGGRVPRVADA